MTQTWRTVRVFISSTFRDMQAERDHLVKVVFPELRERCAGRQIHLVDVDLRWGVPEEEAERGKALEICLKEIEDCRPFFVGLLGERYGYIPPRYEVPDEPAFDWVHQAELGHSITAMEIYQGVLNNPAMATHAFFYFRAPAFVDRLPAEQRADFLAESPQHAEKLRQLKDRIRASGMPVRQGYQHQDLDPLGQRVLEDLWAAIQVEYPADAPQPDPLDVERAYHDFFIATRTELFIGQRHLLRRVHDYVVSDAAGPMVVTGTPGCGKSALLARFVDQFRRLRPDVQMIYHFVGASPNSTDPRRMLLRLCQEVHRQCGFEQEKQAKLAAIEGQSEEARRQREAVGKEYEIPEDYDKLRVVFGLLLEKACAGQRIVLVLDALNQLDETGRSHSLDWLPSDLPAGL